MHGRNRCMLCMHAWADVWSSCHFCAARSCHLDIRSVWHCIVPGHNKARHGLESAVTEEDSVVRFALAPNNNQSAWHLRGSDPIAKPKLLMTATAQARTPWMRQ